MLVAEKIRRKKPPGETSKIMKLKQLACSFMYDVE
jgi:hypothetical protein